uniref:Uncharacterized protein n=1 Tax=Cryptomonas curvata TaxID=233186 RepID=A0A7S0QSD1_9CRYP|mmetsp:Transcript_49461/g.103188  ORF Transcript_49461/g.103188 Transcript_49461/m.103188 type:complete len:103 (+) Transcript_49461:28-336(+)
MGASQSEPENHHGESLTISFCTASRWKTEKRPPAESYVSYVKGGSRETSPLKSARSNSDAYKDIDYRLPYSFNFPKFAEASTPSPPPKAKPAAQVKSTTRFV